MDDAYTQLLKSWENKHLEHLIFCLENHKDYFADSFCFDGITEENILLIDGETVTKKTIVQSLATYYLNETSGYQTPFGDFLYLAFTDLIDSEADILSVLE